MKVLAPLRRRRVQILGGLGVAVVVLLAALVALPDDTAEVQTASDEDATTTSESTTTTEPTTTSESTTTTTAAPATTVPPTTTTAPPPPPTTEPPPPAVLDRMELLAWAKAHPGTGAPYMYSGSSCEVGAEVYDQGDDTDGDIGKFDLVRDCEGSFRAFDGSDMEAPTFTWVEVDARSGGCEGVDVFAVIAWNGSTMKGAVVSTPGCDPSTWSTVGGVAWRNPHIFDFAGGTFGDPASFRWRAGILGSAGDTKVDLAPNSGWATFER